MTYIHTIHSVTISWWTTDEPCDHVQHVTQSFHNVGISIIVWTMMLFVSRVNFFGGMVWTFGPITRSSGRLSSAMDKGKQWNKTSCGSTWGDEETKYLLTFGETTFLSQLGKNNNTRNQTLFRESWQHARRTPVYKHINCKNRQVQLMQVLMTGCR